jgi:integrase
LQKGWSPFFSDSDKNYKSWNDAINDFKKYLKKMFDDGSMRKDTLRTYNSNLNLLELYIKEKKIKIIFALQVNLSFCNQYLDWIYMERGNGATTRNNHLIFLRLLCNYFLSRGILAANPTVSIKNLPKAIKKRIYIPNDVRVKIEKELQLWNDSFYCLCLTIYYCMIRNSELAKMQVKLLNLEENSIFLPKEISKNKKDEVITIPADLFEVLKKHVENSNPNDLLFSSDKFNPGTKKMPVNKIQQAWNKLRDKLELKKEYQFYSLKDTGITDLFLAGLPAIKIRDQARHSSVQITELYTPRNMGCDEIIKNANNKF